MRLTIVITSIFLHVGLHAQLNNSIQRNPINGHVRTVTYSRNFVQGLKNLFFDPVYYTKIIVVRDSSGKLIWRAKMKRYAFGCDKDIGRHLRYKQYFEDKRCIKIKSCGLTNDYRLKMKKKLKTTSKKTVDYKEINNLTSKSLNLFSKDF